MKGTVFCFIVMATFTGLGACGDITVVTKGVGCDVNADCTEAGTCRTGVCEDSGVCSYTVKAGSCFVDGQCYLDGQFTPGDMCRVCDSKQATGTFLNVVCESGTCIPETGVCQGREPSDPCEPNPCAEGEICVAGEEQSFTCEAPDPCDPTPCAEDEKCIVGEDGSPICETTLMWCQSACANIFAVCAENLGTAEDCLEFCEQAGLDECGAQWQTLMACLPSESAWVCLGDDGFIPADGLCVDEFQAFENCENPCKVTVCAEGEKCVVGEDGSTSCETPVMWCQATCANIFTGCPEGMEGTMEQCLDFCKSSGLGECGAQWQAFQACLPSASAWVCLDDDGIMPADYLCMEELLAHEICDDPCQANPCDPATEFCEVDENNAVQCISNLCNETPSFVEVFCDGCDNPQAAGIYKESMCVYDGFVYKGQAPESYICFTRDEDWRIAQTGCGWEVQKSGEDEGCPDPANCDPMWNRVIRLYSGKCADMPESGWTVEGLTTDTTYNGFGDVQPGTSLKYTLCF